MQGADKGSSPIATGRSGSSLRIGVVQARFNQSVTDALAQACLAELQRLGVASENIRHLQVPGALEVPLALQALAERHRLTAYDCAYLDLALRLSLPLATADDGLRTAALAEGLELLG